MKLRQKLSSIAASWPTDPFRPNIQLKSFLEALSTHPKLTPQAVDAVRSLRDNELQKKVLIRIFPPFHVFYLPNGSTLCQKRFCGQLPSRSIMIDSWRHLRRVHKVSADLGGRSFWVSVIASSVTPLLTTCITRVVVAVLEIGNLIQFINDHCHRLTHA
jgi:hypothetical protein